MAMRLVFRARREVKPEQSLTQASSSPLVNQTRAYDNAVWCVGAEVAQDPSPHWNDLHLLCLTPRNYRRLIPYSVLVKIDGIVRRRWLFVDTRLMACQRLAPQRRDLNHTSLFIPL